MTITTMCLVKIPVDDTVTATQSKLGVSYMTDEEIKIMRDRMDANYLAHSLRNKEEEFRLAEMGIAPFVHHITEAEKVQVLSDWAVRYEEIGFFLETGTREGNTLFAMMDKFKYLYSVELNERWYNKSMKKYRKKKSPKHVRIEHGDCLLFIPKVLEETNDRCFIWLDAHGKRGTPILDELKIIFNHSIKDHLIAIDDAYEFSTGHSNYPSIYQIRDLALENGYNFTMENERAPEIMILYPQ